MSSRNDQRSIALWPAAIAGVLAATGVAGMVFVFVSAAQVADVEVSMKSADVAYRAGATITPTSPSSTRTSKPLPAGSIMVSDELRKDL